MLPESATFSPLILSQLLRRLHSYGINYRYLQLVLSHLTNPAWVRALVGELIARSLKNALKLAMNSKMKTLSTPSSRPFTEEAVQWINEIFSPSPEVPPPTLFRYPRVLLSFLFKEIQVRR